MITHCPSCQTHFRVHAEQLAARAGQVRCGKCSRVFDALEYLTEEVAPARKSSAAQEYTPVQPLTAALAPGPEATAEPSAEPSAAPEPVPEPEPEPAPEPEPEPVGEAIAQWALEPAFSDAADSSAEAQEPAILASVEDESEAPPAGAEISAAAMPDMAITDAATVEPAAAPSASPATAHGPNLYDFGPIAAADPAKRARRWPWLLGAFLLLLLLLAQASYHYRSAILVLFPAAKPYAVDLCASLGCDLPLPRRIEQMSIEASDLQADTAKPNIMVLSATLKNRAVFAQQLPLLELTLTDSQDQPLVRRVLAAQDYIGKAADIQAGFAANSEIAIKVFIEGSKIKATGYRLYLFYP